MPQPIRAPQVTTGTPVDIGTVLQNGSGDALSLANHVHKMGAAAMTDVLNAKRFIFGDQANGFTTSAASSDTSNALTKKVFDAALTKKIAGSTSLSAVMTGAPNNKVTIRENSTNDPIDTGTNHEEVYGRLTGTPTALAQTYTWGGTTTVLSGNTGEVVVGDWIKLDADGQYFEISVVTPNVSVTILNPGGVTIPTGATASSKLKLTLSYYYEDSSNVEQTYTFAAPKVIDVLFGESLTLYEAPHNSLQTGVAFQEMIPGSHTHDDRYVQKSVLTAKGSLVGASGASTPADVPVGSNGQVLTANSGAAAGVSWTTPSTATHRQEAITAQNITNTDTALTDLLDNAPVSPASVKLFLNGVRQNQGAGKDYTIAGQTITWLALTGTAVDMVSTDDLYADYQS